MLSILVFIWIVLVVTVLALWLYRVVITRGDYTVLHVRRSELTLIPEQLMHTHRLTRVDHWGGMLTAVAVALGIVLAALYLYAPLASR